MIPDTLSASSEAAILSRVIKPDQPFPAAAARSILRLDFEQRDRERMHELAVKNQDDALTAEERTELQSYLHVGLLLDLLRAKACRSLKDGSLPH
jgi:hypothetical protein